MLAVVQDQQQTLVAQVLDEERQRIIPRGRGHIRGGRAVSVHAQGLGHAYSPNCTSIMQQGFLSFNTPQPHDSYDFDQLYPGYWTAPYAC